MKTSEQIDKLAEALALAQGEYSTVTPSGLNSHFSKSRYATLKDINTATRKALSKYGLAMVQSPWVRDGRTGVTGRLIHKSGQWIEDELSLKPQADTPQGAGSAITYARRYQKSGMLDVEGDHDDDGEAAEGRGDEGHGKHGAVLASAPHSVRRSAEEVPASASKASPQPRPHQAQDVKLFDINDPNLLSWLEKKLTEKSIPEDKHDAIAKSLNGKPLNAESFAEAIALHMI